MNRPIAEPRSSLIDRFFPHGIPGLWCAMPTHWTADRQIDWPRMAAHLNFVRPHVKGFLFAGAAGDGLTLAPEHHQQLVDWAINTLVPRKEFLMIGGTHHPSAMKLPRQAQALIDFLQTRAGMSDLLAAMLTTSFTGWCISPPPTLTLSQTELHDLLAAVLQTGLPIALDHPPVTTAPSLEPSMLALLAAHHENLLYFREAAGQDAIAQSEGLPPGVFRFRGQEGNYTPALGSSGGPYHGLLIASAAAFPKQFDELVLAPALGQWDKSRAISSRITAFMHDALAAAQTAIPTQNENDALIHTCKTIDHHMAHGPSAPDAPLPWLANGQRLPDSLIQEVGRLLSQHELMPVTGYLS